MGIQDFDDEVVETLINFKLVPLKSEFGQPAALRLMLASPEHGVRIVQVTCGTDWVHALANEFAEASQNHKNINNLNPNRDT